MRRSVSFATIALTLSCGSPSRPTTPPATPATMTTPTFSADLDFLRAHGDIVVLESPSGAKMAISPGYQARVMTSAFSSDAPSLGWINRRFIDAGRTGTQFDNYGGEDRFWLGPEGGKFALYFPRGAAFTFAAWQTPHALQEGAWETKTSSATSVTFTRRISVTNYAGTTFDVAVERTIRLVDPGARSGSAAKSVAYESSNTITNVGSTAWTRDSGVPSIWILGMFAPAPDAKIAIPFRRGDLGPVVNDAYFGKIAADRLAVDDARGCVVLKADGKSRGKIGVSPARSIGILVSYAPSTRTLTLVRTDGVDPSKPYVDNLWEKRADAYGGDVLNAYNDGPTEPGKPPLGGFYELETSSPAAELAPGASLTHVHTTIHVLVDDAVRAAIEKGAALGEARCLF